MRIGIMGGTFDPIHYGHLNSAEEIAEVFKMDRVIFIPAFIPPHKKKEKITDVYHRLMMTMLATLSNPRFTVSTIEIERDGYSYTIDTVNELRNSFKRGSAKNKFYFIVGVDAFKEIFTWKDSVRLLKNCDFIVTTRPGYKVDDLFNVLNDAAKKYKCYISLKGAISYVYSPDDVIEVRGGNPGMTKGGTGDVLAGLTVALLAKNDPFLAASSASYIVKRAADELHKKFGVNYNADDLADKIPSTFKRPL